MANKKLTDLTELTTPADNDFFYIVDVSDTTESPQGTSKKIRKDKVDSGASKENLANKQNDLTIDGTGTKYPTVDAINALSVNTISELRLLSIPTSGQVITLMGYYVKGDKRPVNYTWNDTSTVADNGGDIIKITSIITGRWIINSDESLNVVDFGAKGDGITNDAPYFVQAGTNFTVPAYGTYRIATSISAGKMNCLGGTIQVDSGITLTVKEIVAAESTIIFTGLGKVDCTTNTYSVGWFAGNGLNEKWDFCKRGLTDSEEKIILIPRPRMDDPAMVLDQNNHPIWGITAPFIIDNAQNVMTMDFKAGLKPKIVMPGAMMIITTSTKAENITFPSGLLLCGERMVQTNLEIRGGARLHFQGWTYLNDSLGDALDWNMSVSTSDICTFENLNVTGYGRYGVSVNGSSNLNLSNRINNLFTNGSGFTATSTFGVNLLRITGAVRGLYIDRIIENVATGYNKITDCYIRIISNTSYSAGVGALSINEFTSWQLQANSVPVLITEKTTGTRPISVQIENIRSSYEAAGMIQLNFAKNVRIGKIHRSDAVNSHIKFIQIASDCSNVDIGQNDSKMVNGFCDNLTKNGKYFLPNTTIPTNTAISINLPSGGFCRVNVLGVGSSVWSSFLVKAGSAIVDAVSGATVNTTTGVLTGTTGSANMVTVSVSVLSDFNRRLYIENRVASDQDINVTID